MQHCLASKGWKIIIADESHTLRTSEKPPDARHTEAAVSAVRRSRRAIFLTGTPSLSRPFDLFRQVLPGPYLMSSPAEVNCQFSAETQPVLLLYPTPELYLAPRPHSVLNSLHTNSSSNSNIYSGSHINSDNHSTNDGNDNCNDNNGK